MRSAEGGGLFRSSTIRNWLKAFGGLAEILKPRKLVVETFRGVVIEQPERSCQQLLERKLVGKYDAMMLQTAQGVLPSKRGEVCGIVGDDGSALPCRESKLIGVGRGYSASVLSGKDVVPPIGEDACQQGVYVLIEGETRRCHPREAI